MSADTRFHQAARRALGVDAEVSSEPPSARRRTDRFAAPDVGRDAQVERVSIDVRIDDRAEAVVLVIRDGELAWSCTDGTAGRESAGPPASPYVRCALRWLGASPAGGSTVPELARLEPGGDVSADDAGSRALAGALDDAITALVRAGIAGRDSPSVRDAIDGVVRAIAPTPHPVARWIGRLERAMRAGEARLVARLLDGAALAADDLRASSIGPRGHAWLGRGGEVEQIVDRAMIEVARELVDGTQRAEIERRYLVDVASGEIFREERARGDDAPSLGPCPRAIAVGLAEATSGPAPRRLRLLQYSVSVEVPEADLERVVATAARRTALVVERYRQIVTEWPALGEPATVIAIAGIEDGLLIDAVGEPIPIARDEDPGAAAALDAATKAGDVEWIVGRVVDVDGAVRVVPCSFARRGKLVRLR